MAGFKFDEAFSRNLGWLTSAEQHALRDKTVAVAGLGGVGGSHLLVLARLGIGRFHLADPDHFELANFNRQAGADMSSIGRNKIDVMVDRLRLINPDVQLKTFPEGVTEDNLADFAAGADLYIDGLDLFVLDIRRTISEYCHTKGIPTVIAAPLGMGASWLVFAPGHMSFEEYFRFEDREFDEKLLRFLIGLAPRMLHRPYIVDEKAIDLAARRVPSTVVGCELASSIVGACAVKLLLGRGPVKYAPWGMQFDAYRGRMVSTWRPMGNRNPLQAIAIAYAKNVLARFAQGTQ